MPDAQIRHTEACNVLIDWFRRNRPDWRPLKNSTGYASAEHVKYGVPSIGGGPDFYVFGPGGKVELWEVKTSGHKRQNKKQKNFMNLVRELDLKYVIFLVEDSGEITIDQLWPLK